MVLNLILSIFTFFSVYGKDALNVIDFCNQNREVIKNLEKHIGKDNALTAISIVAPEISRYTVLRDKAESMALKIIYVNGGSVDFSIGPFQMKPSFAYDLEKEIVKRPLLKEKYNCLLIEKKNNREERSIRVERLSSLYWQLEYLAAFYEIAIEKISIWNVASPNDRIQIISTLYNAGINNTEKTVRALLTDNQFPNKGAFQFNYSKVVLEFFENPDFCKFLR